MTPPTNKPRTAPEHVVQKHCVAWFRLQHPKLAGHLFAIPNGGQRSKATAGKLKAEGQLAGVGDLFLMLPGDDFHGLWIELKTEKGRQSPEQKEFEVRALAAGYQYRLVRSLEEFQTTINSYLNP